MAGLACAGLARLGWAAALENKDEHICIADIKNTVFDLPHGIKTTYFSDFQHFCFFGKSIDRENDAFHFLLR